MRIFKCEICGNIVELINDGGGTLVCCGQEMEEIEINTEENTYEKHIPFVQKEGNKVKVQIGKTIHPMIDEHYIEWIALIEDNFIQKVNLKPGDEPIANFTVQSDNFTVYTYCNIHGFYMTKNNK
ncbi:MAG: desulfoferrodoxin [Mollicutes bacterium]|jgi:superoxide reductase|nr:desulfoferrodoxin [Mollicutes bacterium]